MPGRAEFMYEKILLAYKMKMAGGYVPDPSLYAEVEKKFLNQARTCYITADMVDLATYMAGIEHIRNGYHENGLPKYELFLDETKVPILEREMLPFESGLLILEKPFPLADYDEATIKEHGHEALGWVGVRGIGWEVTDQVSSSEVAVPGIVFYIYIEQNVLGDGWREVFARKGWRSPPMILVDFSGWSFGTTYEIGPWLPDDIVNEHMGVKVRPHTASIRMFMTAVWGLMQSYLVPMPRTRPQSKRAKRLKMPEDGDISVIHLRKFLSTVRNRTEATDYDKEGNPKWSHRWIVRGHWAWRNCKCPEHDGRHRVYIDPYIKGPEHLPLVIKEKVISIDR